MSDLWHLNFDSSAVYCLKFDIISEMKQRLLQKNSEQVY